VLTPVQTGFDYIKRDVMIPMRDGVKLHTVIVLPKGAHNAPMLLTRTLTAPRRKLVKLPVRTWGRFLMAMTMRPK